MAVADDDGSSVCSECADVACFSFLSSYFAMSCSFSIYVLLILVSCLVYLFPTDLCLLVA